MNLLVTGGAGFIGSNFIRYWRRNYPQDRITVIDNLSHGGRRENVPGDVDFIEMDICDISRVNSDIIVHFAGVRAFPTVVHFAAQSHVDRSIQSSDPFVHSNILGTHALLEVARFRRCRFHHISTDEVFGSLGPNDAPFTEQSRYDPQSPYAATKASSDHLVRAYANTYGMPVTVTHCSNNYGPYQSTEKLMPLAITNALQGKSIPVYGMGNNIRDWIHVSDHCRAIDLVIKKGAIGETYNVGGSNEITNLELIQVLCDLMDVSRDLITFVKDRLGHDYRYAVNDAKIRKLGYTPEMPFKVGLIKNIQWYRDNAWWWKNERPAA